MKKLSMSILGLTVASLVMAQEPTDALRYSYTNKPGGTARTQAIGGAGVSLGGDFSSLFSNPAGLGFYKTGDFVLTPSVSLKNTKGTYLNSTSTESENHFNLGTTGVIFASPGKAGKALQNISIGIGVNRSADFNNHVYYRGTNQNTSYSEKYLEELTYSSIRNADSAAFMFPLGSSLAINTYLVDPVFDANDELVGYRTQADPAKGLLQENNILTTGGITDLAVGAGFNLNDQVYFGGTLSVPFLNYTRNGSFRESDANGTIDNFKYFEANEFLETKGVGIAGKLGIIVRPTEGLRFGATVHSPTFYQLTDNYTTQVVTDLEGYGGAGVKRMSNTDLSDGYPLKSTYNYHTPWKFAAGATYMLHAVEDVRQQKGFITADVEYVDYGSSAFKDAADDWEAKEYYNQLNSTIQDLYTGAVNVRLGGEMKFNTIMARLGGAYYGNPYKNEDASFFQVSGGAGYRHKGFYVDLTYVHNISEQSHYPYRLSDASVSPAILKNNTGNIVATIGFKL